VGELTASIAHEVNQPLAAVIVNANACVRWLRAEPPNVGEAEAAAHRIARDARRAADVVSRIRALVTRSEPEKNELQIAEVIREVVRLVDAEARAHQVTLVVAHSQDLPAVLGDRIQLQQVLLNLTLNAIESMQTVTDRARILDLGVEPYGVGYLCVKVRDCGPGLAPEQRDRIFDAFYTTKPRGMGMGLAISRSIVDAHGGRLWATANADGGETFQFTLPTY
jgi:C4-dicarboxylate-specific signal transduction histidine kinase